MVAAMGHNAAKCDHYQGRLFWTRTPGKIYRDPPPPAIPLKSFFKKLFCFAVVAPLVPVDPGRPPGWPVGNGGPDKNHCSFNNNTDHFNSH